MSMKVLPKNHKHQHCSKQRCMGDSKDYQNYIAHPPSLKKKQKRPYTTRSQRSIHDYINKQPKNVPKEKPNKPSISEKSQLEELKKKYEETSHRNGELLEQIQEKSKKINEFKHRVKDYEAKIKTYEQKIHHLQSIISENEHPKSPMSLQKPAQKMLGHYQQQLKVLESSQKTMLEHMQKYRLIEKQYHQYKNDSERKIQRLMHENEQLRQIDSHDKDFDGEIESLRKELHKYSENHSSRHSPQISGIFQNELIALKTNNKHLMVENEHLICRIEEQGIKEGELKHHLQEINRKVERWGVQYKVVAEERHVISERCKQLEDRLRQKKERHQIEKEEWGRIFKGLMGEVEKLKKELGRLEKSNHKLINLYSQQTE